MNVNRYILKHNDKIFRDNLSPQNTFINITGGLVFQDNGQDSTSGDAADTFKLFLCKKMLYDVMTETVVKYCFPDTNQRYIAHFIGLINQTFNQALADYRKNNNLGENQLLFIYKGGTPMKILFDKYKKILAKHHTEQLFNELTENFKRSDSDFSIYIDPTLTNFNDVYYDINKMTYDLLVDIRNIIITNGDIFIPFSTIDRNALTNAIHELNNVITKVKNDSKTECTNLTIIDEIIGISYKDNSYFTEKIPDNFQTSMVDDSFSTISENVKTQFINNKTMSPHKKDFSITFNDQYQKVMQSITSPDTSDIYISINETNEYNTSNVIADFSLQRMKLNFIVYYKTVDGKYGFVSCPAELIDISILKRESTGLQIFYEHIDLEKKIYAYQYHNLHINYVGYSIYGHINDLLFALFDVSKYPWDDAKYKKRIRRLCFFAFLELFTNFKRSPKLILILINKMRELFGLTSELRNSPEIIFLLKKKADEIAIITSNLKKPIATSNFFTKLIKIYNDPTFMTFIDKYEEMTSEILKIFNLIFVEEKIVIENEGTSYVETVPAIGGKINNMKIYKFKSSLYD